MALPTITRTWEFRTNVPFDAALWPGTDEEVARALSLYLLNHITGKKKKAYGGTFADQGGGTVRFTATAQGGNPYITGSQKFDASDVGEKAIFVGCTAPGNNGSFVITAVDTSAGAWVEFTNGSASFGADSTASMHVDDGYWTTPLTVKGSSASYSGRSYGMDGRDRWLAPGDIDSDISGNRDWFVVQTAGGAEMLFWHDTYSASYQYEAATIGFSAENGFSGGTLSTRPTATDYAEHIARGYWPPTTTISSKSQWFISMMMSVDGTSFRCFMHGDPDSTNKPIGVQPVYFAMEPAGNPITGSLIPWNGNHNLCTYLSEDYDVAMTYSRLNDAAKFSATIDKDGSAGGPYVAWFYLTTEQAISSMVGEQQWPYPNRIQREYQIYPMGLYSSTAGVRGRHGTVVDMWFNDDGRYVVPRHGSTYPVGGTGTHLVLAHTVVPWDGSEFRKTLR